MREIPIKERKILRREGSSRIADGATFEWTTPLRREAASKGVRK